MGNQSHTAQSSHFSHGPLFSPLQGCADIATLHLAGCRGVTDAGLSALAEHSKKLVHLDLNACVLVTNEGLVSLAELSELQRLNLSGCRSVSDAGIVPALQSTLL